MKLPALFLLGVRLVLGGVMVWAGGMKISEPERFAGIIAAYDLLPSVWVFPFAFVIPWVETLLGFSLVAGLWTRSSALLTALLLTAFGIALSINVYRGADISCGCFGVAASRGSLKAALAQDSLLLAGALILLFSHRIPFSLDERLP